MMLQIQLLKYSCLRSLIQESMPTSTMSKCSARSGSECSSRGILSLKHFSLPKRHGMPSAEENGANDGDASVVTR